MILITAILVLVAAHANLDLGPRWLWNGRSRRANAPARSWPADSRANRTATRSLRDTPVPARPRIGSRAGHGVAVDRSSVDDLPGEAHADVRAGEAVTAGCLSILVGHGDTG